MKDQFVKLKSMKHKSMKQIALELLRDYPSTGFYITVAEACRQAGLADPAGVRKHIYSYGGMIKWRKKGCPI